MLEWFQYVVRTELRLMRIPGQFSLGLTVSVLDSSISLCKCNNVVDMIIIRHMVM